jgi:hypothetical protein
MSDGIVVGGGSLEEIGNRFEVGGCSGSLSSCEAPVFEPPLKGSGGRQPVLGRGASGLTVDGYSPR